MTQELQGLLAGATPGPWAANRLSPHSPARVETLADGYYNDGWMIVGECLGPDAEANIDLIVAAVNALPQLLASLTAKDAEIAELEREQADWTIEAATGQRQLDALCEALTMCIPEMEAVRPNIGPRQSARLGATCDFARRALHENPESKA